MRTFMIRAALFAAAHMAAIVAPKAEAIHYTATLTGAAEIRPPTTSQEGALTATYDTGTKKLEWTVDYSGGYRPSDCSPFPLGQPGSGSRPRSKCLSSSPTAR